MNKNDLKSHILTSYSTLRWGTALIGLSLPFVLWLGGLCFGIPFQDSMSHYYYATDNTIEGLPVMRDWFVGSLFAVGVFLYSYRGFTLSENLSLNYAGIFAIGIAIFPMGGVGFGKLTVHGICAVLFFLCIAYVCVFCAPKTLPYLKDPLKEKLFKKAYLCTAIGMIVTPAIAFLMSVIFKNLSSYVFFVEAVGVVTFAFYWILKTVEIGMSKIEK